MRRGAMFAAFVVIALGTVAASPGGARPEGWRHDEVRFATSDGRFGWSTIDVRRTIASAVRRWPVPGGLAMALSVARCESGTDLLDYSTDGYTGTYQQATRYWSGRRAAYNPPAWDKPLPMAASNPRANVVVSIRMAHANGWSNDWPGCS